jgi:hypothetical protein
MPKPSQPRINLLKRKLTEFFNHFAFKVGALVGVNPLRYTIMYYEVIKESFSCCFSKLILGWDRLQHFIQNYYHRRRGTKATSLTCCTYTNSVTSPTWWYGASRKRQNYIFATWPILLARYYEVIKESFSCCFSKLILGWDRLGISSVVILDDQNMLVSSFGFL